MDLMPQCLGPWRDGAFTSLTELMYAVGSSICRFLITSHLALLVFLFLIFVSRPLILDLSGVSHHFVCFVCHYMEGVS